METNTKIPVKAVIYHVADGNTAIKAYANIAIGDYLYINSFSVVVSSYSNTDLLVYPPSVKCGNGKYKRIVEFPGWEESSLKEKIDKLCTFAYGRYEDDNNTLGKWTDPIYIGIEELVNLGKKNVQSSRKSTGEIDLSDIPF